MFRGNPAKPTHPPAPPVAASDWSQHLAARVSQGGDELTAILALADAAGVITFSGGFPAPETFPAEAVRQIVDDLLTGDSARTLQYSPTEGLEGARHTVAALVADTQGLRPATDDVLVTSGGIEALQLLSHVLLDPGDTVLVEAPSYLGALMAFAGSEARVVGIEMDADGLVVADLDQWLAHGDKPKFLYVIPDHQNPTGLSLSRSRRHELVEVCRRHGVLVVEDVAYRELGFDGQPLPSLWSLGPDVVVQIGTFSKILFPGVRLGWAIGPRGIVRAMTAAKQNSDQCAGALGQRIMERYVADGHLQPHLALARSLYARRAGLMLDALERHMPPTARWTTPRGGFFVWLSLDAGVDTRLLSSAAQRSGVAFVPGAPFYVDGRGANQMRLSFSRVTEADIDEGIGRLAALLGGGMDDDMRKTA